MGITKDGYGPKTYMGVTLDTGLLTQRVDGAYNYEGGDLKYVLTYGDRSLTDPEFDAALVVNASGQSGENQAASAGDILLYVGIGLAALAAIGGGVLLLKKKKPASAEKN